MAGSQIEIELDTGGVAASGLDLKALQANMQAELGKLALQLKEPAPQPTSVAAPQGAQGMDQVIHWLMQVAAEPQMVKVYIRTLIFSMNEIATAARTQKSGQGGHDNNFVVRVKAFGKEIALPTTQAIIEATLDEFKGH